MNICIFREDEISLPLDFSDERARHILKILHKKEGDTFSAGILNGFQGTATIQKIQTESSAETDEKKFPSGKIYFSFAAERDGKKLRPLTVIVGFPRPIQLKRILRDLSSLGVERVMLTGTELGEKSYMESDLAKKENAQKFLLDGAVQAASTFVPEISLHKNLAECISCVGIQPNDAKFVALDNVEPDGTLSAELKKIRGNEKIVCAVGSERGWTKNERKIFREKNFRLLSMGERILRTETASTVSSALILGAMGFLE
jgi:RsmE family RNA methyltransferase